MMTTDPYSDPMLAEYVAQAMEAKDEGQELVLEELCADRLDLVEAVRETLETGSRLPGLQRDVGSFDRMVGRVIADRYRLDHRIGSGAMGAVYRAQDEELGRAVAVKILRAAFLDGREAELRFQREAEVLASLAHPTVVAIYDRGRMEDGDPYLVMELLEGRSLADLLATADQEPLGGSGDSSAWVARELGAEHMAEASYLRTAVRWTADLAGGLAAAHSAGIFHRDVKPSNILIRQDGSAVLIDFGIAVQEEHSTLTQEGSTLGTPAYMPPEALDPDNEFRSSLDVYGLSASLFHMLTLRPPISGTPSQILNALMTKEVPSLRTVLPGVPKDLAAIVDCGMARNLADRYQSAAELEADLRAFIEHRPVTARHLGPVARWVRRAKRSVVAKTLMVTLVTMLAATALLGWRERTLERRDQMGQESLMHLPAALGVSHPDTRTLGELEGFDRIKDLLDFAVENCRGPLPSRLLRAAFRLDHGQVPAAREDYESLAKELPSPLTSELSQRMSSLPADAQSAWDLNIEDLPEPQSEEDCFILAFHLARVLRRAEAAEQLDRPGLENMPAARELLVQVRPGGGFALQEGVLALEKLRGHRTASTASLMSSAMIYQKRFEKALEYAEEGLLLCPDSYFLLMNKALSKWRLGQNQDARAAFDLSARQNPDYEKPQRLLATILLDMGEVDLAVEAAENVPFGESTASQFRKRMLFADIKTVGSLDLLDDGKGLEAMQLAQDAADGYAEADELYPNGNGPTVDSLHSRRLYAEAIAEERIDDVFRLHLESLAARPRQWQPLEVGMRYAPAEFREADREAVMTFLRALVNELALEDSGGD